MYKPLASGAPSGPNPPKLETRVRARSKVRKKYDADDVPFSTLTGLHVRPGMSAVAPLITDRAGGGAAGGGSRVVTQVSQVTRQSPRARPESHEVVEQSSPNAVCVGTGASEQSLVSAHIVSPYPTMRALRLSTQCLTTLRSLSSSFHGPDPSLAQSYASSLAHPMCW